MQGIPRQKQARNSKKQGKEDLGAWISGPDRPETRQGSLNIAHIIRPKAITLYSTLYHLGQKDYSPHHQDYRPDFSLSFLSLALCFTNEKTLKLTEDFCPLPSPLKPRENRRKRTNNQGISLLRIYQGIQKTKERNDRVIISAMNQVINYWL